jgi:hypothetical protein
MIPSSQIQPMPSESTNHRIEILEARAGVKKSQLKSERELFIKASNNQQHLCAELEETERQIADFDDGTCPTCHNNPAKTFADLKERRSQIEAAYRDAHEDVIDRAQKCHDIDIEINCIETEVHEILIEQRSQI